MNKYLLLGTIFFSVGCWDSSNESIEPKDRGLTQAVSTGETSAQKDKPADSIWEAIKNGRADILESEIKKGADVNATTSLRMTPNDIDGKVNVAKWLKTYLKYHQLIATNFYSDNPAICKQAPDEDKEQSGAEQLLGAAINDLKNLTDIASSLSPLEGLKPIHVAAMFCETSAVDKLIELGADTKSTDAFGLTALHYATCGPVADRLIKAGADVSAKNPQGLTPLHTASDRDVARLLIKAGANVNAKDKCGNTPLHYILYHGYGSLPKTASPKLEASPQSDTGLGLSEKNHWLIKSVLALGNIAFGVLDQVISSMDVTSVLLENHADQKMRNNAGYKADEVRDNSPKANFDD